MQTLKVVRDTNDPTKTDPLIDTETGDTADKIACILKYLRSLEHDVENVHGNNDDWRYGRYLVHGMMIAALKNAEK